MQLAFRKNYEDKQHIHIGNNIHTHTCAFHHKLDKDIVLHFPCFSLYLYFMTTTQSLLLCDGAGIAKVPPSCILAKGISGLTRI